jgi:hypothetical protein
MSEEMAQVPEPEWPTHCEHCGTRLASAEVGVMPGGDEQLDTVVARDFCPNPDCPGRAAGGPGEASVSEERPGSMGGDNGGG